MNITITDISPGERYAGVILNEDGTLSHHLILLPQMPDGRLNWNDAMAWAEKAGGTLPTRQEQHLLFANCKDAFESAWYWSSEQYVGNASDAWAQHFDSGNQCYGGGTKFNRDGTEAGRYTVVLSGGEEE